MAASRPAPAPFEVTRRPDGIVVVNWIAPGRVTLENAVAILEEVKRASGGAPAVLLVNTGPTQGMDRDARTHFQGATTLKATALLVGSPVSRVVANLFIGLNRPAHPISLFTKEDDAVAWLRAFLP